jgi:cytochrome P450
MLDFLPTPVIYAVHGVVGLVGLVALTVSTLIVGFVLRRYIGYYFSPLHQLPGPKGYGFWVGTFWEVWNRPFFEPQKEWWDKEGVDCKMMYQPHVLGSPHLVVLDKDIIKTILTAPSGKGTPRFEKRLDGWKIILGDGLLSLDGDVWRRHRRILEPSFNSNLVKESLNDYVPKRMDKMVQAWKVAAETGREIDAYSHLSALALDAVGAVGFNHDFKGVDTIEKWAENDDGSTKLPALQDTFIISMLNALELSTGMVFAMLMDPSADVLYFLSKFYPHVGLNRRTFDKAVDDVIAQAKLTSAKPNSLLHLMLKARDPESEMSKAGKSLNHFEIQSEVKTFLMAGHETTATWLYWALFTFTKHPDVQEKVYQDVMKYASSNGEIGIDDTAKMIYMNAFLQEVLRLYPPGGWFFRGNTKEEVFDGKVIPANTRIVISPILLHRHPTYWDNPDDRLPERWMNVSAEENERRRFAFLPFSAGGRNCIGQLFATLEVQMIVAHLVRAYRFELSPSQRDTEFKMSSFVTTFMKPEFKIVLKQR